MLRNRFLNQQSQPGRRPSEPSEPSEPFGLFFCENTPSLPRAGSAAKEWPSNKELQWRFLALSRGGRGQSGEVGRSTVEHRKPGGFLGDGTSHVLVVFGEILFSKITNTSNKQQTSTIDKQQTTSQNLEKTETKTRQNKTNKQPYCIQTKQKTRQQTIYPLKKKKKLWAGLGLPMPRPYRVPYLPTLTALIPHFEEPERPLGGGFSFFWCFKKDKQNKDTNGIQQKQRQDFLFIVFEGVLMFFDVSWLGKSEKNPFGSDLKSF